MPIEQYGWAYITASNIKEAKQLAKLCLNKKLTACVNIFPSILSYYNWENILQESKETALVMKTRKNLFKKLSKEIKKHHSYNCPCILFIPFTAGEPQFLKWMKNKLSLKSM